MPSLTDATIRAATPPAKGQKTLWDGLKGFGIRLSQGGSKTFIVMIGSGKRFTIGRYPAVSLAEARTEAKRILAEKQLGKLRPARVSLTRRLRNIWRIAKGGSGPGPSRTIGTTSPRISAIASGPSATLRRGRSFSL